MRRGHSKQNRQGKKWAAKTAGAVQCVAGIFQLDTRYSFITRPEQSTCSKYKPKVASAPQDWHLLCTHLALVKPQSLDNWRCVLKVRRVTDAPCPGSSLTGGGG